MNGTVRTFRAPDARSALAAVKAALGPDAVILSTRELGSGLFGTQVEVVAGLSAPAPTVSVRTPPAAPARPPLPDASAAREALDGQDLEQLRRGVTEVRQQLEALSARARSAQDLQLAPAPAELHSRLCMQGVEPVLAEELVRQALREGAPPVLEPLRARVHALVSERLIPDRAPWLPGGRRVVALVGPTGVGKTTTLAKIAARALVESRLRVAMITVDTYRIGAAEQLGRYGKIMDVPVLVARDARELQAAVERCKNRDLVLIDTAGRAARDAMLVQAEVLQAVPDVSLHLVLSAATGPLELAAAADRYRALGPSRLIFTKIDEAAAPGGVLSAAVRISRPVSAIADGQRVPEDLHPATTAALADLVVPNPSAARP